MGTSFGILRSPSNFLGMFVYTVGFGMTIGVINPASAQTTCDSVGPDLIIADINGVANYTSENGIEAFSLGQIHCNIGDVPAACAQASNAHPIYAKNLFRLTRGHVDGSTRFEQLGYAWLMHAFFALSGSTCCPDCEPSNGTTIGVHCSDSNTASRSGSQIALGPKWQVNAATGVFPFPQANPPFSGTVARRLQVATANLTPSNANNLYFAEVAVVSADDAAAGNKMNNASYRPVMMTGSDQAWTMSLSGSTVRETPGIFAWQSNEPTVVIKSVDVPNDGRFYVAANVNAIPGRPGWWHYEYAVYNMNSDRSTRTFAVPLPAGVSVEAVDFHDVSYHSGDGPGGVNLDGTDWTATTGATQRWATQVYGDNENANALRWGTLYNFRFDANATPTVGAVTMDLFKPGTPTSVTATGLPIPGGVNTLGDVNGDGIVDLTDLSALLASFGLCTSDAGFNAAADFDGSGCVELSDLSILLANFGG